MDKIIAKSPGRINMIGEHTDYNEGLVLPAAIDKYTEVRLMLNGTREQVRVEAKDIGEVFEFRLAGFSPLPGGWQNYIMGVVFELQQLKLPLKGFDCSFPGQVPIGSGLSSSAALECSLALALNGLFNGGLSDWELIKAAQRAEHHFVGNKCGIMDQFASIMGRKGQVLLLDCATLEFEYFPLNLQNHELMLLNTNVTHTLTAGSTYNTRRSECESGFAFLKDHYPGLSNFRELKVANLDEHREAMPAAIWRRCKHVISENERVLRATQAMEAGDYSMLGDLLYQSHQSLQNDFEVSCPELDFLVEGTKALPYVLGARMMGGGFGGCTLNLVQKGKAEALIETLGQAYSKKFEIELSPYEVQTADGGFLIS